jgi:hypothetical protein
VRVYYRTGRRSGVSLGPIGLLIVGPFILMFYAFVFMLWIAWLMIVGIAWVIAALWRGGTEIVAVRRRYARPRSDRRQHDDHAGEVLVIGHCTSCDRVRYVRVDGADDRGTATGLCSECRGTARPGYLDQLIDPRLRNRPRSDASKLP